jgi:hypothetical protein
MRLAAAADAMLLTTDMLPVKLILANPGCEIIIDRNKKWFYFA